MNMSRVENIRGPSYEEKGKKGRTLNLEIETIKPLMRSRDLGEELLPGIQNYITLHMVSPMLSWGDLARLSTVSPGWQEALESRLVYNERVCSHSTESLAVVTLRQRDHIDSEDSCDSCDSCRNRIFLYSMKDESWYELPLPEEILVVDKCVALDSKLYVIGGVVDFSWIRAAVYVLDLVGERQWKQCASPQGIIVGCLATDMMQGKIYVFDSYDCICGVYDPKVDAWSYLSRPERKDFPPVGLQMVTLGEEIFLERGRLLYADVYHPDSGLGREIEDFQVKRPKGATFLAQGKLLVLNTDGIFGLDIDEQSWILLQPCSFPFPQQRLGFLIDCLAVGHELVALASVNCDTPRKRELSRQRVFLQSCGFGQENKEIVWEIIAIPGDDPRTYMTLFHPRFYMPSIQCFIQL